MIDATDLKNGTTFLQNEKPYQVIKYSLIKMGRGGAVVRVSARNLLTRATKEKTFSSNATLEEVNTSKRQLQFLFKDSVNLTFMDPKTYEQIEIPASVLGDASLYVKEGDILPVFFWGETALSIELPPKITLKVVDCDPGVRGNSAINIYKPAILENGIRLKVPLFINSEDKIKVDTRTGEYVERAK